MTGGEAQILVGAKGFRIGQNPAQNGLRLRVVMEVNQSVGAVVDERRIAGIGGDEGGVEKLGFVVLAVAVVELGEQACDVVIGWLGCVKLFEDGQCFVGLVLGLVKAGKL